MALSKISGLAAGLVARCFKVNDIFAPVPHKFGVSSDILWGKSFQKLVHAIIYIRTASWENQHYGFRTGPTQTELYSHREELEV